MKKRVALLLLLIALVLLTGLCRAEVQGMTVNGETVPNGGSVAMTEFDTVNIILEDDQEYFHVDYEIYEETPEEKKWLTGGIRMLSNGGTFTMQAPEGYKRVRVDFRVSYVDEGFGRYSDETDYCFFIELSPFERDKNLLSVELSESGYTAWITAAEEADLYLDVVGWCRKLFHLTPGEPYQYVNDGNETVKLYAADANDEMSTTVSIPPAKYRINGKAVEPGDTVPLTDLGNFDVDFRVEDHVTDIEYTAYSVATGEPLSNGPFRFKVENNMTNAFTVHSLEPQLRYEFSYVYDDGTVGEPFEIFANVKASGAEQDDGIVTVEMKENEATFVFNREAQLFVTEGTLGGLLWARNGESVVFEAGETYRYSCENFLIPRGQTVTLYAVAKEDGVVYRSPDYVLTGATTVLAEEEPDETGWMLADAETVMITDTGETEDTDRQEAVYVPVEIPEPEKHISGDLVYIIENYDHCDDNGEWVTEEMATIVGSTGVENVVIPVVIDGYRVSEIEEKAFRGDLTIRSLTVQANNYLYIGEKAFDGCLNLTKVRLNGDISVSWHAFRGIGAEEVLDADGDPLDVTKFSKPAGDFAWMPDGKGGAICTGPITDLGLEVVIPDTLGGLPVTGIGERAFYDETKMETMILPETLTSIGDQAFSGCDALTEIRGGRLEAITENAFVGCENLRTVEGLDPHAVRTVDYDYFDCRDYIVTDGSGQWRYYTDAEGWAVLLGPAEGVEITKCVIPETLDGHPVGRIDSWAFSEQASITSVVFPEGLYAIGRGAFSGTGITALTFPTSLRRVEESAFYNCTRLKSLVFPASVVQWGNRVFSGCEAVTKVTIEDGVTKLPDYIFQEMEKLTAITIPASVRSVGKDAFASTGLKKVTLPATVAEWGESVFYHAGLTSVTIEDGIREIPKQMFFMCENLTSVTLPESVKSVGDGAFSGCKKLSKITLNEGLEAIGKKAFISVPVTKIVLPASVKSIGDGAFEGCEKLTNITLNEGLETIGEEAFEYVPATKIVIPASVKTVGKDAFKNSERKALSVTVYGTDTEFDVGVFDATYFVDRDIYARSYYETGKEKYPEMKLTTCSGSKADLLYQYHVKKTYISRGPEAIVTAPVKAVLTRDDFDPDLMIEELTIPEGVEELADDFMNGMISLTKVTLPTSLKKIGANAFAGCINLGTVSLPKGLASIGKTAFDGCTSLKSIVIPESVTDLSEGVFNGCQALTKVTLPEGLTEIPTGCFFKTGIKQIKIPATVRKIGETAFGYCESLTSVTLPKGLEEIPGSCFAYATGLTACVIPDTVVTIGAAAFSHCEKLTAVTLPKGLKTLSEACFAYSGLKKITIPASVETLGTGSFGVCKDLKQCTLPEGLTEIPEDCFYLSGLTSVKIPSTVRIIGKGAFEFSDLQTVTLQEGLEVIEERAFNARYEEYGESYYFADMTKVTVPSTVTRIGEKAFAGQEKMKKVTILNPDTEIGKDAFWDVPGYQQ